MNNRMKIISVLLCMLFLFGNLSFESLFTLKVVADEDYTDLVYQPITYESHSDSNNDDYLCIDSEQTHFLLNKNVVFSCSVSSGKNIVDFTYSQNGFNIISVDLDDNNESRIVVELACASDLGEYTFEITASLENGQVVKGNLFAIKNDYGVFISTFSLDNARERYYEYAIQNGILTKEQAANMFIETYKGTAEENVTVYCSETNISKLSDNRSIEPEKVKYQGCLRWYQGGYSHYLRKVKVEIYIHGSIIPTLLGTEHTDNNGYFEFDIPAETDVFLRIYAGDDNAMVKRGVLGIDYCYESAITYGQPAGTVVDYNATFTMDQDYGQAFQISQALLTARDYAKEMMGKTPSDVSLWYPYDGKIEEEYNSTNNNGCFYNNYLKIINITGRHPSSHESPHSYESWDVIMHEYGHHIQFELEIIDSPNGGHGLYESMAEHYKEHYSTNNFQNCNFSCAIKNDNNLSSLEIPENMCKYNGCSIAWAEAWATVFGIMAQEYFSDYLSNIEFVNDVGYTSYNGLDAYFNDIPYIASNHLSEDVEGVIVALLYDMYDSYDSSEEFDRLSLSDQAMWDCYTDSKAKTLYEFVEYIKNKENYKSHLSNLGKLLNQYNLSTGAPRLSNLGFNSPTVEFEWGEPNEGGFYSARKFSINFYDYSYNLVCSTVPQVVSPSLSGTRSINIDDDLWQTVLNLDTSFYISITVGEYNGNVNNSNDDGFITNYNSEYTRYFLSELYQDIHYTDSVTKTLGEGDFYWFRFVAPLTDEYVFESIGTTDTYGELFSNLAAGTSTTNRLVFNDNEGEGNNFKITYCLNKGDVIYLRVRGNNWINTGVFTVSVSSVNHMHDYTYSCSKYSSSSHKSYCCCGLYVYEGHDYYSSLGRVICKRCGYSTEGFVPVPNPFSYNNNLDVNNQICYISRKENE